MATRKRIRPPEKEITLRWQALVGKEIATQDGRRLKLIYPGRANGGVGPDFRNAVIAMNDSQVAKGDVEIHVRSSDWYRHGHHRNPGYDHVILHAVLWDDCPSATLAQNGRSVPVVNLSKANVMAAGELPCVQKMWHRDDETLRKLLDAAGENRFEQKTALFRASLGSEGAGQVLYRGMMRALGYSRNMKPFEELANRLPIRFLQDTEARRSLSLKQALLLGTAGLLPSQWLRREFSAESKMEELEHLWRSLARREPMSAKDWHLSHVYHNNSPVRRILAQSHLLHRYREMGLVAGILEQVARTPLTGGRCQLEDSLIIASDNNSSALLGHSKAGEIIVNAILPFVFSWAEALPETGLSEKALKLYLNYPKLAENEISRHMARQLRLEDNSHSTACRQQGLIHIFTDYCSQGNCTECPLVSQG
jgi:hypothetical protein